MSGVRLARLRFGRRTARVDRLLLSSLPLLLATSCFVPYLQGDGSSATDASGGDAGSGGDGSSGFGGQGSGGDTSSGGGSSSGGGGRPSTGGGDSGGGNGSGGDGTGGDEGTGGFVGGLAPYNENPGADCAIGQMPSVDALVADDDLPNPFISMDGSAISDKGEWLCRREEILRMGESFMYGPKPRPPVSATSGSVSSNSIAVAVENNGDTASFGADLALPIEGEAPYPVVIVLKGAGEPAVNLDDLLLSRGIARIALNAYEVGAEVGGTAEGEGAFYELYGSIHDAGVVMAWAWGVSRIIDLLEQHPETLDPTKVGVTGCSRFAKGAFVAGAYDNRVALTMPQESGVAGTAALRLIEILDPSSTEWAYFGYSYQQWLSPPRMSPFATANTDSGDTTNLLPIDAHSIIGLIAPRGLYIMDNPSTDYPSLNRNSAHVTADVGARIYDALGFPGNITYQAASGTHCGWRGAYEAPLIENFERFLLGGTGDTGTFETDHATAPDPDNYVDWGPPALTGEL